MPPLPLGTTALGAMKSAAASNPRIGIVVVAYNAANTLAQVLDRIPSSVRASIAEVLVCDDHSSDATYLVGLGYKSLCTDLPLTVIRHERNLGYGGNQKAAYRMASEHGLDIVVLLHGDGQYAPERLPDLLAPLLDGGCDAVFGSRMLEAGAARAGGMPRYKYVGNHILTKFENAMLGSSLSEFHSGYRAYRVDALDALDLDANSDGFDFDTQVIIQLHSAGRRIVEVPIPTYYGDEICYVNGMKYARDISLEAARYGLRRIGIGSGPRCLARQPAPPVVYGLKEARTASHSQLVDWVAQLPSGLRVLDLGCAGGLVGEQIRALGNRVVGVDVSEEPGVRERLDAFVECDLEAGVPAAAGGGYDVVLAADVIEHVRDPARLLQSIESVLTPTGSLLVSVPNFGHWYPRLRTALGLFDYDERGILDRGHLRFFTVRSFLRLVEGCGYEVRRRKHTGIPFERFRLEDAPERPGRVGELAGLASRLELVAVAGRPQLFAYQMLFELGRMANERAPQSRRPATWPEGRRVAVPGGARGAASRRFGRAPVGRPPALVASGRR